MRAWIRVELVGVQEAVKRNQRAIDFLDWESDFENILNILWPLQVKRRCYNDHLHVVEEYF